MANSEIPPSFIPPDGTDEPGHRSDARGNSSLSERVAAERPVQGDRVVAKQVPGADRAANRERFGQDLQAIERNLRTGSDGISEISSHRLDPGTDAYNNQLAESRHMYETAILNAHSASMKSERPAIRREIADINKDLQELSRSGATLTDEQMQRMGLQISDTDKAKDYLQHQKQILDDLLRMPGMTQANYALALFRVGTTLTNDPEQRKDLERTANGLIDKALTEDPLLRGGDAQDPQSKRIDSNLARHIQAAMTNTVVQNDAAGANGGVQRIPAQQTENPGGAQRIPAQQTENPGGAQRIPAQQTENPGGAQRIPAQQTENPGGAQRIPAQQTENPGGAQRIPAQQTENVAGAQRIPAQQTENVAGAQRIPAQQTENRGDVTRPQPQSGERTLPQQNGDATAFRKTQGLIQASDGKTYYVHPQQDGGWVLPSGQTPPTDQNLAAAYALLPNDKTDPKLLLDSYRKAIDAVDSLDRAALRQRIDATQKDMDTRWSQAKAQDAEKVARYVSETKAADASSSNVDRLFNAVLARTPDANAKQYMDKLSEANNKGDHEALRELWEAREWSSARNSIANVKDSGKSIGSDWTTAMNETVGHMKNATALRDMCDPKIKVDEQNLKAMQELYLAPVDLRMNFVQALQASPDHGSAEQLIETKKKLSEVQNYYPSIASDDTFKQMSAALAADAAKIPQLQLPQAAEIRLQKAPEGTGLGTGVDTDKGAGAVTAPRRDSTAATPAAGADGLVKDSAGNTYFRITTKSGALALPSGDVQIKSQGDNWQPDQQSQETLKTASELTKDIDKASLLQLEKAINFFDKIDRQNLIQYVNALTTDINAKAAKNPQDASLEAEKGLLGNLSTIYTLPLTLRNQYAATTLQSATLSKEDAQKAYKSLMEMNTFDPSIGKQQDFITMKTKLEQAGVQPTQARTELRAVTPTPVGASSGIDDQVAQLNKDVPGNGNLQRALLTMSKPGDISAKIAAASPDYEKAIAESGKIKVADETAKFAKFAQQMDDVEKEAQSKAKDTAAVEQLKQKYIDLKKQVDLSATNIAQPVSTRYEYAVALNNGSVELYDKAGKDSKNKEQLTKQADDMNSRAMVLLKQIGQVDPTYARSVAGADYEVRVLGALELAQKHRKIEDATLASQYANKAADSFHGGQFSVGIPLRGAAPLAAVANVTGDVLHAFQPIPVVGPIISKLGSFTPETGFHNNQQAAAQLAVARSLDPKVADAAVRSTGQNLKNLGFNTTADIGAGLTGLYAAERIGVSLAVKLAGSSSNPWLKAGSMAVVGVGAAFGARWLADQGGHAVLGTDHLSKTELLTRSSAAFAMSWGAKGLYNYRTGISQSLLNAEEGSIGKLSLKSSFIPETVTPKGSGLAGLLKATPNYSLPKANLVEMATESGSVKVSPLYRNQVQKLPEEIQKKAFAALEKLGPKTTLEQQYKSLDELVKAERGNVLASKSSFVEQKLPFLRRAGVKEAAKAEVGEIERPWNLVGFGNKFVWGSVGGGTAMGIYGLGTSNPALINPETGKHFTVGETVKDASIQAGWGAVGSGIAGPLAGKFLHFQGAVAELPKYAIKPITWWFDKNAGAAASAVEAAAPSVAAAPYKLSGMMATNLKATVARFGIGMVPGVAASAVVNNPWEINPETKRNYTKTESFIQAAKWGAYTGAAFAGSSYAMEGTAWVGRNAIKPAWERVGQPVVDWTKQKAFEPAAKVVNYARAGSGRWAESNISGPDTKIGSTSRWLWSSGAAVTGDVSSRIAPFVNPYKSIYLSPFALAEGEAVDAFHAKWRLPQIARDPVAYLNATAQEQDEESETDSQSAEQTPKGTSPAPVDSSKQSGDQPVTTVATEPPKAPAVDKTPGTSPGTPPNPNQEVP